MVGEQAGVVANRLAVTDDKELEHVTHCVGWLLSQSSMVWATHLDRGELRPRSSRAKARFRISSLSFRSSPGSGRLTSTKDPLPPQMARLTASSANSSGS